MKVLLDLTYAGKYPTSGLVKYAFNLLDGFRKVGFADNVVLLVESGCAGTFEDEIVGFRRIGIRTKSLPHLPFTRPILSRKMLERIIRSEKADIFLSTYVCDRSLVTSTIESIGVIHDTWQFRHQKNLLLKWRFNLGAIPVANSFTRIVTISESARKQILALGTIKPRLEVIYVSIVSEASPALGGKCATAPYILDVNTMYEHKNPITLLRAFNVIKERIPHNLVFKASANDYWNNTIMPYVRENGLQSRVILIDDNLNRNQMDRLYSEADLFVSPSEMEGFGMTPIEAAMSRVPVICNALDTLVESTRGLVEYYSPSRDYEALSCKILEVLAKRGSMDLESIASRFRKHYSTATQAGRFIELFQAVSKH